MKIFEWLDQMETEGVDVAQIELPRDVAYEDSPDETIYFKQLVPCGIMCPGDHPFATVERFGHWYYSRGQDKSARLHSKELRWKLFTRDRELAIATARSHIE